MRMGLSGRARIRAAGLLSCLACGNGLAVAQEVVPDPHAIENTAQAQYHLQVEAPLVLLDVSVERKGSEEPLRGLGARDFAVEEDGQPQRVESISEDTLPLSLVFLFDLTDTVHPVLEHLSDGAAEVLRSLRPEDEIAVVTFSSSARLEQRFTRDRMAAREAIDAASASYQAQEPTFVYEDLWQAVQVSEASRLPDARRVQVWVTDGSANDQVQQRSLAHRAPAALHTEEQATKALLTSDVVVSALIERSQLHGEGRFGDVEHFADETGGPVVYATAANASARFAALLDALRARYTLGYRPAATRPAGTLSRLQVRLSAAFWAAHPQLRAKDVILRARGSYMRR